MFRWIAVLANGAEILQMLLSGFVALRALTVVDALQSGMSDFSRF